MVTPPSSVHYSKKGTYPGNLVPPNQAGQTPDPGQVLGSLKCDPFFAPHELLEGRLKEFLSFFPRLTQTRVGVAGEPNTTEPSKVVASLYPRGRGTKDSSAFFSSSLCSRFVKMIINS